MTPVQKSTASYRKQGRGETLSNWAVTQCYLLYESRVEFTKDPNLGPFSQLLLAEEEARFYQFLRWNYTLNNLSKRSYC